MHIPIPKQAYGSLALIAALTVASCASGSGGPPRGPDSSNHENRGSPVDGPIARPVALIFAATDLDQNMVVTREEAIAGLNAAWTGFADGIHSTTTLSLAGWLERALGTSQSQPSTLAFDTNFDGVISRSEFDIRFSAIFKSFDRNNDGELSRAELVFTPVPGRKQSSGARGSRSSGERRQRGGPPPR